MLLTKEQNKKITIIPDEMITILNLLYSIRNYHSIELKIKMIKSLRIMGTLLGKTYNLKECKIFIEEKWQFKE